MAGFDGPVPKRSDQRRRRNKSEVAIDHAAAGEEIEWPEPSEKWHPIARQFYDSLQVSGQSAFYERTDVSLAFYTAEIMSRSLSGTSMNANLFAAVMSAAGSLLATEGDRRRLRIELQRNPTGPTEAELNATADMANYRKRLA